MTSETPSPVAAQGGFNCPRCRGFIPITLQALLGSPHLSCSQCGLELSLDLQRSAAAMAELRKLAAGTAEARRMLDDARSRQSGRE